MTNSHQITFKVKAGTAGLISVSTRGLGEIIRWKAGDTLSGLMVAATMENTWKIRSRASARSTGLMEGNILGIGRTGNSMAMVLRLGNPAGESGSMGNGPDGMTMIAQKIHDSHAQLVRFSVHSNRLISQL